MDADPAPLPTEDVRPQVRTAAPSPLAPWAFAGALAIGGIWLFSALNANRLETADPASETALIDYSATPITAPAAPPLPDRFLASGNEAYSDPRRVRMLPRVIAGPAGVRPAAAVPAAPVRLRASAVPAAAFEAPAIQRPAYEPVRAPESYRVTEVGGPIPPQPAADVAGSRARASRLANPATTVPLGTMIPAVLETALDSTQPGFVRAIVQHDIRGFDGATVLIPRGSRLYGEYQADLQTGQKRALVRWTRLLRPDGVTIALDSPATDPMGRAGITGKLDSKFFQRFGAALMQSVLDVGVGLATRRATDGVVVALPGATTNITGTAAQDIRPTLSVRSGTSLSVYVARDLDFADVSQ